MIWTPIQPPDPDVLTATRETIRLAALGAAPGQCLECGSYRLDGTPPYLHQPGCESAPSIEASIAQHAAERR